ncbi:hypothetical protein Dimus_027029, partial [Dionaea muscipula]
MKSKDQVFAHSNFLGSSSRSHAETLKGFSSTIPSQIDAGNLYPYIQGVCRESVSLSNEQLFRLMVGKRLFFCRILNEAVMGVRIVRFRKPYPVTLNLSSCRWKTSSQASGGKLGKMMTWLFDVAKVEAILWCSGNDKRRSFDDKTEEPDISEVKWDGGKEAFSKNET